MIDLLGFLTVSGSNATDILLIVTLHQHSQHVVKLWHVFRNGVLLHFHSLSKLFCCIFFSFLIYCSVDRG